MVSIEFFLDKKDIDSISKIASKRFSKYKKRYVFSKIYFIIYLICARFVSVWGVLGNSFIDSIPIIAMFLLGLYVYVLNALEYKQTKILMFINRNFIIMEQDNEYTIEIDNSAVIINKTNIFNINDFSTAIVFDGAMALTDGHMRTILIKCTSKEIIDISKILQFNKIKVFKLKKQR